MDKGCTTDEDTNGSFEFVEKGTDSAESEDISSEAEIEKINNSDAETNGKESTISEASKQGILSSEENKRAETDTITFGDKKSEGTSVKSEDAKGTAKQSAVSDDSEEWMDILGSGQLLKKVLKEGTPDTRPERGDVCVIKYECSMDGVIVESHDKFEIQIGDVEVIQGLDLALPLMNVGEIAEIEIGPRFAYGFKGFPPLYPPDVTLTYKVELLSAKEEPPYDAMSVEDRQRIGTKKKDRGNWWFSRDEYSIATQCYKRAIDYLGQLEDEDYAEDMPSEEASKLVADSIKVYNNLVVAHMRTGQFEDALKCANTVLKKDPTNLKALFRKGKILASKNEVGDAIECYSKVLEIEPDNSDTEKELKKCQLRLKEQEVAERKLYKKMLGKPLSDDEVTVSRSSVPTMKIAFIVANLVAVTTGILLYYYYYHQRQT